MFISYICDGNSSAQLIKFYFMEIRLYKSFEDLQKGKQFYCVRVETPDAFDYNVTKSVFTTIYGANIIFVVIAL